MLGANTIVVSILAGVEAASLRQRFPAVRAIVRAMPNLPVASPPRRDRALQRRCRRAARRSSSNDLFARLALRCGWPTRRRLAALGSVAGAGPAYVARFVAALTKAGVGRGLTRRDRGDHCALETVLGTAWMAATSGESMESIAERVASPKGTTEAGLAVLDHDHVLDELIALDASTRPRAAAPNSPEQAKSPFACRGSRACPRRAAWQQLRNQGPFDDRDGWIWLDGELVPWRDARVHVLTHALHYASSVFEGQRAYNGVIFKLREHSERLRRSASLLGFELPWTRRRDRRRLQRSAEGEQLHRRLHAAGRVARVGIDGRCAGQHQAASRDRGMEVGQIFRPAKSRATGIRLDIAPWRRPAPYTAPSESKAAGLYMICTLSKQHAESRGYHDALMLDWRGRVAEATGANVFFVKDGALHTPVPDCFLDGITRRTVMDLARKRGIEVVERPIWPEELESFEQAFLTGTAAEVTAVQSIGPYKFEVRRHGEASSTATTTTWSTGALRTPNCGQAPSGRRRRGFR